MKRIFKIIFETIAELIIIFTVAAIGATIGSGKRVNGFEWFLAAFFVFFTVTLRKYPIKI